MIYPTGPKILVSVFFDEDRTESGLILVGESIRPMNKGKVVFVGPGFRMHDGSRKPLDYGVDDIVFFGNNSGVEVEDNGVKYRILHDNDVLCIDERSLEKT